MVLVETDSADTRGWKMKQVVYRDAPTTPADADQLCTWH